MTLTHLNCLSTWFYFIPFTHALAFLQPTSTIFGGAHKGNNVRPTQQTQAPQSPFAGNELEHLILGRQITFNVATCGYFNGLAASPITCPTSYQCGYYPSPATAPNFGCCSGSNNNGCAYVSTCIDNGVKGNNYTGSGVFIIYGAAGDYLCGTNVPYCTTVILYGTGAQSYLSYGCGSISGTTITGYQTTTGASSLSSSIPTSPSSSTPTTLVPSTSSPSTKSSSSPAPNTGKGGLSTGAQAGIGVGVGVGVGGILIGILLYFCLKRRDRRKNVSPNSMAQNYSSQTSPTQREMDHSGFYAAPKVDQRAPHELYVSNQPAELSGTRSAVRNW